jgi:hypothetical protein
MTRAPALLLMLLATLTAAAGACLVIGSRPAAGRDDFQRLVGGLGGGPALDLAPCPFAFDPRLDSACAEDYGPVPAGTSLCPYHACSVFEGPSADRGGADAPDP